MKRKKILIGILICAAILSAGCNSQEDVNSKASSESVESSIESSIQESSEESIEESSDESSEESEESESSEESSEPEQSDDESSDESSEESEKSEKSSEPQKSWKEQYIDKAREYYKSISEGGTLPQKVEFELLDMDQDGMPELIISTEDESYNGGIIFSFADGKATEATEHIVINQEMMYQPQSKQIALLYGRSDFASLTVCELKDGYFERVLDATVKLITPESPNGGYYHIDGRDVSKDQFDSHVYPYLSTYTEFNSNWTYILGKKRTYTEAELKNALSVWG